MLILGQDSGGILGYAPASPTILVPYSLTPNRTFPTSPVTQNVLNLDGLVIDRRTHPHMHLLFFPLEI